MINIVDAWALVVPVVLVVQSLRFVQIVSGRNRIGDGVRLCM